MSLRPINKRVVIAAALLVLVTPPLLLVYFVLWFDWNHARPALSKALSARMDRTVTIDGDLRPSWAWPISRLRVSDVRVTNIDGASAPQLLDLAQLDITVDLRNVLAGRFKLSDVHLVKPVVHLERTRAGVANWKFAGQSAEGAGASYQTVTQALLARTDHLTVEDGHVTYLDAAHRTDIKMRFATEPTPAAREAPRIRVNGSGLLRGEKFELDLSGGSLRELGDATRAYPVSASIVAARTAITVQGTVRDLSLLQGLDLTVTIKGSNAADLFPLTGIALPPTPPYSVTGKLDFDAGVWRFNKFAGRLGDSDLAGDLRWDVRSKRPMLTASFTSRKLDMDDLAGLIGAPPGTGPGETASAEQVTAAVAARSETRLLPDMPLDITRLAAMDAKVEFRGLKVLTNKLPINDFYLKAELTDRILKISPVRFGTGSGNFVVWATLNAQQLPVRVVSRTELQRIPIASLFDASSATIGTKNLAQGYLGGTAELHGSGQSLRQMLSGADGTVGIGMQGGQLSQLLIEIVGLDIAESLGYLIAGDRPVAIQCVIADFEVSAGVLTPRAFVIDTQDTVVTGTGSIDLRDESLKLELKPAPKDFSPLALRVPLEIAGTLKNPDFQLKRSSLLARGAAAAVLAVLFPPAAILALIEPGLGEDSQCRPLLAAMASNSADPKNNARLVPSNPTPALKPNADGRQAAER